MSAQQNRITKFFETDSNELNVENEIQLFNGLSVEYDFNNTDLTANFSLSIDDLVTD